MLSNLLYQASQALLIRVAGTLALALNLMVVTRNLNVFEVGQFALFSSLIFLGRYLGPLGNEQLTLRTITAKTDILPQQAQQIERAAVRRTLIIILSTLPFFAFAFPFFLNTNREEWLYISFMSFLLFGSSTMSGILFGILRSRNLLASSLIGDGLISPVFSLLMLILGGSFGFLTVEYSIASVTVGSFIGFIWQLAILLRAWGRGFVGKADPGAIPFPAALSLWLTQLLNFAQSRFPLYIAAIVLELPSVALIEISSKIVLVPSLATWALGVVIAPKLASSSENIKQAARYVLYSMIFGFIISSGILFVFAIFGEKALEILFGIPYSAAYWPTLIMLMSSIINGSLGVYATYLIMTNKESVVSRYNFYGLLSGVLISIVCVKLGLGPVGVACGYFTAVATRELNVLIYLWRQQVLIPEMLRTSKIN